MRQHKLLMILDFGSHIDPKSKITTGMGTGSPAS
jgi:hypothetical protein